MCVGGAEGSGCERGCECMNGYECMCEYQSGLIRVWVCVSVARDTHIPGQHSLANLNPGPSKCCQLLGDSEMLSTRRKGEALSLERSVNLDQKVPIQAPDALTSGSSQDPEQEETRKAPVKAFGWISGNTPCTTGIPKYEKGRLTGLRSGLRWRSSRRRVSLICWHGFNWVKTDGDLSPLMTLPQSWSLYITYSPPDSLEGISLPLREKGNSYFTMWAWTISFF